MTLPDGNEIPLDVVAARWTKLSDELVTVERLWDWHNEGVLTIVCRNDRFLYNGRTGSRMKVSPKSMATYAIYDFWITPEERDRFELEYLCKVQPETVQSIPGEAEAEIAQMTPGGGDRLTEKLYDFANEVGAQHVTPKGFKVWLRKNHSDFDVSHDIISYIQKNGNHANIDSASLGSRIWRMNQHK